MIFVHPEPDAVRLPRAHQQAKRLWYAAAAARGPVTIEHEALLSPFTGYRIRLPELSFDVACRLDAHGPSVFVRGTTRLALDAWNTARLVGALDELCADLAGRELELDFADADVPPLPAEAWTSWPGDDLAGARIGAAYATHLHPTLIEAAVNAIRQRPPTAEIRVLDLGAGSAPYLEEIEHQTGVPVRATLIDPHHARASADEARQRLPVDLTDVPALQAALAGRAFDLVISSGGLNLSVVRPADARAALALALENLVPGGTFTALGYTPLAVRATDLEALAMEVTDTCAPGPDRVFRQVLVANRPTR